MDSTRKRTAALLAPLLVAIYPIVTTETHAHAAPPACQKAPSPSGVMRQQPWNQTWFDAPDKIWPYSTGAGTTVAVIDAGVDGSHPQLAGKVLPGYDLVRNVAQGDVDCIPHGTAEAGIIAARRISGIGFYGLAPDATILPIRVSERVAIDERSDPVDPRKLADGITYAVDHGADVIDCAVVTYQDSADVAAAVDRAVRKGVVVVAMVGDSHSDERDGAMPTISTLTPYPAGYPGVIGVGAIDRQGRRVPTSQVGSYVDLVAPGADVGASATVGQDTFGSTSIASAFVAATAALVLAERPPVIGSASGAARVEAVTRRLRTTGGPAPASEQNPGYGAGIVDPYRALTEIEGNSKPAPPAAHPLQPAHDPADTATARSIRNNASLALLLAETLGTGTILLLILALVLPRGRARRWRATRVSQARRAQLDVVPEFVPGEMLFEPPRR